MVKTTARFGPPKSGYDIFSHPAGHGHFKPKNTQTGNKSQFPGANVHFQQMLREAKTKSKKFRIRWAKVPRVLEPLNSSYGHVSHPAGHGRFKPKNTQNGNKSQFPGANCIFSKCCERQKRSARNSASDGQKYRAFWTPSIPVMAILVTRLATAVSSRKTPKLAINRDFPGLRAFSANVARGQNEEQESPHPMVKSTARFGDIKFQLWPS